MALSILESEQKGDDQTDRWAGWSAPLLYACNKIIFSCNDTRPSDLWWAPVIVP